MPNMISPARNFTLRTTSGHVIAFKKGEPTWVPPVCEEKASEAGCTLASGESSSNDNLSIDEGMKLPEAPQGSERKKQIRRVVEALIARNDNNDFTAGGKPKLEVLKEHLKFDVSASERDAIMTEIAEEKADA